MEMRHTQPPNKPDAVTLGRLTELRRARLRDGFRSDPVGAIVVIGQLVVRPKGIHDDSRSKRLYRAFPSKTNKALDLRTAPLPVRRHRSAVRSVDKTYAF